MNDRRQGATDRRESAPPTVAPTPEEDWKLTRPWRSGHLSEGRLCELLEQRQNAILTLAERFNQAVDILNAGTEPLRWNRLTDIAKFLAEFDRQP